MLAVFRSKLGSLITAIIERKADTTWEVTWAPDSSWRSVAAAPKDFIRPSLAETAATASSQVAALYANRSEAATAELQMAIYPWTGKNPGNVMLDITQSSEGFVAADIQGSSTVVEAAGLDELVLKAEGALSGSSDAMFRWTRKVADLAPPPPQA